MVEILKALGDETRLRIVNLLNECKLCVCELEETLEVSQSNVSRHLNRLKNAGIINSERRSQWIYYELSDEFLEKYGGFWKETIVLLDNRIYKEDIEKLKRFKKPTNC